MRIEAGFTSDFPRLYLTALNHSPIFIPTFAEQERVPAPPPLDFLLRVKDHALDRQCREAFMSRLCSLNDEWIGTGRDASGEGEDPNKRNLRGQLWHVVNDWWAYNRPDVLAEDSGEPKLSLSVLKVNFTGDDVLLAPVDAAKEEAVRWFAWFLNLPHRYRLCKCRSCGEYYYIERRPKGFIKYGTYCLRHRHLASAKRANERRRAPERERKLDLAVRSWGKWPRRLKDFASQAQWVAERVNEKVCPQQSPIKRNWVTRHRREIETEANRRSKRLEEATKGKIYAKSKRT